MWFDGRKNDLFRCATLVWYKIQISSRPITPNNQKILSEEEKSTALVRASLIHSFRILSYLHSAPSRNLLRGALSPATAIEKCPKKLTERRHVVPGQQAECKREFISSGGANNRESSTLFKRRAGPRKQELTTSRRTKGSAGS